MTWPGAVYTLEVGSVGTDGVLTIDDTHRDMVLAVTNLQGEGYAPDQTPPRRFPDQLSGRRHGARRIARTDGEETDVVAQSGLARPAHAARHREEAHKNLMLTKAIDLSARRKQPVKLPLDPDEEKRVA